MMQCQIHQKVKKSKKGHNFQKTTMNQGPEDYRNPQNLDQERSQNPQNLDLERSQNPQNPDQERSQNLLGKEIEKRPSLLHHQGQGKGQILVKKTHTKRSVLEQGPDLEKTVKKGPAVGPAGTARKGPDPKIVAQKDQKDLDHVKAKKVLENTDPDQGR